jgi:hypothetical protein
MSQTRRLIFCFVLVFALLIGLGLQTRAADTAVVEARMLADLKFLSSEACQGRGIRTEGINKAADHIVQEFQRAGLKPGGVEGTWFQPFLAGTGTSKLLEGNRLVLHGPQKQRIELELGKHFSVVGLGNKGKVTAPVVFTGYGISSGTPEYDDYAGLDVSGKVVINLRRVPRNEVAGGPFSGANNPAAALNTKAANAEVHKAAAVLFINDRSLSGDGKDALTEFGYTAASRDGIGIPVAHIRRHYVNHMLRSSLGVELQSLEEDIDRDLKPRSRALEGWTCDLETNVQREGVQAKNVIGVLEGSGPLAKETVVIGAHYDHLGFGGAGSLARGSTAIHPGADDNASGTTSIIELARRFAEMKERKGRRLVFMLFSAEESGLIGSAYYCRKPTFSLESTISMVNLDMVGRLREDKITIGGTGTAKTFDALLDELNRKHNLQIIKDKSGFGPSDHSSFYAKKIPVFFFYTGMHQQYHRPTDTWDTINVAGMRKVADYVEDLVNYLATVQTRPEYVQVGGMFNPNRTGTPAGPRGPRLGVMPNYSDDKEGVLLDGVSDDGPAKKAGLLGGDRILQIGDKPVKNVEGYMAVMAAQKRGETIDITVERKGKTLTIPVKLDP